MKIIIKDIIKENNNINVEERYINRVSQVLRKPYFINLNKFDVPDVYWGSILSKIFNDDIVIEDSHIYNSDGNRIYNENSDGSWRKYEYNSYGKRIYYENSDGSWYKREYDSNGNEIYYEDSNGKIIDNRTNNINENINISTEEIYINRLIPLIRKPYIINLNKLDVEEKYWGRILSKIFNDNIEINVKIEYTSIYNSNGNEIYYEDSDGSWYKREYDSNGNVIYRENSNGYWVKREYDSNGKEIYYENSDGYWYKREYNSNGNRIYYEDSDGKIIDNRN